MPQRFFSTSPSQTENYRNSATTYQSSSQQVSNSTTTSPTHTRRSSKRFEPSSLLNPPSPSLSFASASASASSSTSPITSPQSSASSPVATAINLQKENGGRDTYFPFDSSSLSLEGNRTVRDSSRQQSRKTSASSPTSGRSREADKESGKTRLSKMAPSFSATSASAGSQSHGSGTVSSRPRTARSSLLDVLTQRAASVSGPTGKSKSKPMVPAPPQTGASPSLQALAGLPQTFIEGDSDSIHSTETIPTVSMNSSANSTVSSRQNTSTSVGASDGSSSTGSADEGGIDTLHGDLSQILEHPLGANPTYAQLAVKAGLKHSEYGFDNNMSWRYTSQYNPKSKESPELEPPYYVLLTTYFSYLILIVLGHIRDFFGKRFDPESFVHLRPQNGYAALFSDFDSFYTRRLKRRLDDCFSRPTTGVAGRTVVLYDRISTNQNNTFQLTGEKTRTLNISSYNYLGFAQATGGCADAVETGIRKYGVSAGGARREAGTLDLHLQAERLCAEFVGTEDAMVVSMGFATNSTTIPALVNKGCLVISDEFNHSSIRFGVRLSGASVRQFKHNDMRALERLLRESISQGQPRTHRPWKKILVIVEGLYSMEGSMVHLPELIVLKERYKFYLYVDEAHSIGALGPNGRGVCDYFGVDPRSVDILMGTFTKSFGAAGGYIAGSKEVIDRLRIKSHAMAYAEAMSPPVLMQVIASMASIMGVSPPLAAASTSPTTTTLTLPSDQRIEVPTAGPVVYGPCPSTLLPSWMSLPPNLLNGTEGRERLRRLAFNSRYLSSGLRKLGFIVYGHRDSPIVPLLMFHPGKMPLFSRMMLDRIGEDRTPIVVVVVAYPATPLYSSRVRFCVSASHTKHDIDIVLRACDEVGDALDLKLGSKDRWPIDQVISRAEELVNED